MNANKITKGKIYEVKVGRNTTSMQVMEVERRVNGQLVFDCMNTNTNKRTTVSDEKRFVKEIKPAKEDTALRESIAKTLTEAGANPQHVEAARGAMAIQAAEETKGKAPTGLFLR